ncbi:type II secretion system protein [Macrococcus capreoli]|uniref:type II secretion system protein n=1 Tax=Macrococcus capreoli TaxID=2982690 RepID=UPI0021D59C30|nr:type II secretion system protein [Macrococcus sp. TMW 2.2395]
METQFKFKMVKQWHKRLNGFSYLESLLVLFIVTIIMMIVLVTQMDNAKLTDEEINDELMSLLNYYQTKSYETGEVIVVTFPPGKDTVYIRSEPLGIKAQYIMKNGKIYEGNGMSNTDIIFKSNGVKSGGTIKYQLNKTMYQIIVQIHRGRMRIEKV